MFLLDTVTGKHQNIQEIITGILKWKWRKWKDKDASEVSVAEDEKQRNVKKTEGIT